MKYAIVDIETTGGNFKTGKITEVAVYLHNGSEQIGTYSTLINPEIPIPPFITHLTGISNEMVADAPTFAEVAKPLREITEDAVFVAHNVNFDYGFIREAFRQIGVEFKRKKLCTVQLSRKSFPGLPSYSLDKVTRELNIELPGHHRAAVDAYATMLLFEKIIGAKSEEGLFDAHYGLPDLSGMNSPFIDEAFIKSIADDCGVFRFYDQEDELIFVKRSENIQTAICEKLKPNETKLAQELRSRLHRIDYDIYGSGLIAQLVEAYETVQYQPAFNFGRFSMKARFAIYAKELKGARQYILTKTRSNREADAIFSTFFEGLDYLKTLAGKCGVEVSQTAYGKRTVPGLKIEVVPETPFIYPYLPKDYLLVDEGRTADENAVVLVENGRVVGYSYLSKDTQVGQIALEDLDVWFKPQPALEMVIRKFLEKKRYDQLIRLS